MRRWNNKFNILGLICLFGILQFFFFEATANAGRKAKTDITNIQGIAFRDFWDKAIEEGKKWAGDKLYIQKITSGSIKGFDRRGGVSPVWEAHLVRCDEVKEFNEHGKHISSCKGKSVIVSMASEGLTGIEGGLNVTRMKFFRGTAVNIDRIAVSATSAEDAANSHMGYRSSGFDNYTYDLKIDRFSNRPLWVIKKACSAQGAAELKCRPKDHWIAKVDAETGEILR